MAAAGPFNFTSQDTQRVLSPISDGDFQIVQKAVKSSPELNNMVEAQRLNNGRLFMQVKGARVESQKIELLISQLQMPTVNNDKALELKKWMALSIEQKMVPKGGMHAKPAPSKGSFTTMPIKKIVE